jgi:hypothetical protein
VSEGNAIDRRARKRHKARVASDRAVNAFVEGMPSPMASLATFQLWYWVKFFIGLALLPVCWVTLETFFVSFGHAAKTGSFWRTAEFWYFGIGGAFWLVLFFGARCRAMLLAYVAGHEWTHALFVLICRGNVAKVHISAEGGHILTNRNNFLISLSPYFFPFYSVMLILGWGLAGFWLAEFEERHLRFLFAAIGFTWSFHLAFTVWMISRGDQPDLDQNGRLFSLALIVLINTLIIAGLLIAASPEVGIREFALIWCENLATFGSRLSESLQEMVAIFL